MSSRVVQNCILIEDEPLAIRQIIKCIKEKDQIVLDSVCKDMDAFFASISAIRLPDIIIIDFSISGLDNINAILTSLPKNCFIVITSVIPIIAFPKFHKQLSQFKYYELCKPFSNDRFNNCIDRIISQKSVK